jgi:hypothetical protein
MEKKICQSEEDLQIHVCILFNLSQMSIKYTQVYLLTFIEPKVKNFDSHLQDYVIICQALLQLQKITLFIVANTFAAKVSH